MSDLIWQTVFAVIVLGAGALILAIYLSSPSPDEHDFPWDEY